MIVTARTDRLLQLGLVLDPRDDRDRLRVLAGLCGRAGLDAVFLREGSLWPTPARVDVWSAVEAVAPEAQRAALGLILDARRHSAPDVVARMAELARVRPQGVELALVGADDVYLATVRGKRVAAVSVVVGTPDDLDRAVRLADGVLVREDGVAHARAQGTRAGRTAETFSVSLELPVSIGRTSTEARARVDADPLFFTDHIGHREALGLFGTLEECQRRIVPLAEAGLSRLLCIVPSTPDVHDVIAQLTALPVGRLGHAPSSAPPSPPKDWGGRPRR